MSDNLQMLGESMRKANSIDDTPTMDTDGSEIRPEDASVEFKNVSFSYGDRKILDGVSIQIPAGSTTAVVGPSGGGKTTLCNLILGCTGRRDPGRRPQCKGIQAGQPDEKYFHGIPGCISF